MQLNVKPISRRLPEFREVCKLMKTAFPGDELISLTMWRILAKRRKIYFFAVYDGDDFIGTVYIVEGEKHLYIPFLAVCEKKRNNGYGSGILKWTAGQYSKELVLHIEPLDESANNYEQRVMRDEFYRRNGVEDTGYTFKFLGVPFAVYSSDVAGFDVGTHNDLMEWFSFHLLRFNFKLADKHYNI